MLGLKKLADDHFITRDDCFEYVASEVFRQLPVNYKSEHPKWPGYVGIEVEMLPVRLGANGQPERVPLFDGAGNQNDTLKELAVAKGWKPEFLHDGDGKLLRVVLDQGDQLTFEPGGQLEISTIPYPCASDAIKRIHHIQSQLDAAFAAKGQSIVQVGINPWNTVEEIALQMDKPRYQAMTSYFNRIGPLGVRMMRQTCTVQVNLDFGSSESQLAKRYATANLLAPFATATFANSPVVDGKSTGHRSYRANIWRGLDRARAGFPNLEQVFQKMDKASAVQAYFDMAMAAPVVFIAKENYRVPDRTYSFAHWLNDSASKTRPTFADLKTHLSLLFPEVRARGFLELRSVDCQSRSWQDVPTAFYTGLLYDETSLQQAFELLLPLASKLEEMWARCTIGLQDTFMAQYAPKIFQIAMEGFERLSPCFRESCSGKRFHAYYENFTARRRSPADDVLEAFWLAGKLELKSLMQLEEDWRKLSCS